MFMPFKAFVLVHSIVIVIIVNTGFTIVILVGLKAVVKILQSSLVVITSLLLFTVVIAVIAIIVARLRQFDYGLLHVTSSVLCRHPHQS